MLSRLEMNIHYTFKQVKWLELALTHSSFANEVTEIVEHNERLEFLGDAVLELVVSELLFKEFPEAREGSLTAMRSRLVSQGTLANLARQLELNKLLRLGRGEERQGGRARDPLLCDAFEAVLGAVFMDGGFAQAQKVATSFMKELLPSAAQQVNAKDSKTLLQEITQKLFQERPVYTLVASSGPEHAKVFEVKVVLPDGKEFTGSAPSLKGAEQAVAADALATLSKGN